MRPRSETPVPSSQQRSERSRPRVLRLISAQATVLAAAAALAGALAGPPAALAAALGGAACLLPQAWFAWRVLVAGAEGDAGRMLRALYWGEGVKLALIVVLLIAIFRAWPAVPPVPLVLGFVAVQTVHWFTPLLLDS